MRESGKVNLLLIGGLCLFVFLVIVVFGSSSSVSSTGTRFMSALAKQDVDELADCSFVGSKSKEEVKEAWKRTFSYSKHFLFEWSSVAASQPDPNNGMVRLQVKGNANLPSSYEERFDLALRKVDGNWKVDVRAISREMYPFLPR